MADDIKEKVLHVFDLLDKKIINTRIARSVTAEIFETGKSAEYIIINRPLKPCCSVQVDYAVVKYSDDLIEKVFNEYPEVLESFKRHDNDASMRIVMAALRACDEEDVKCSVNDLIKAANRYINKSKETENVESQS